MKELDISHKINIDDDFIHLEEHDLWEACVNEARQVFYNKNHDYCSSWRIEDAESISKEILQRCIRILAIKKLEKEGKKPKCHEGIRSEFRDIISWSIFGMLILDGYGWTIEDLLIKTSPQTPPQTLPVKEEEKTEEDPQQYETVEIKVTGEWDYDKEEAKKSFVTDGCVEDIPSYLIKNIIDLTKKKKVDECIEMEQIISAKPVTETQLGTFSLIEPGRQMPESFIPPEFAMNLPSQILNKVNKELTTLKSKNVKDISIMMIDKDNILCTIPEFVLNGYLFKRADILDPEFDMFKYESIVFVKNQRV